MASYTAIRHDADRLAAKTSNADVKALAKVVAELAHACEATDKTAKDAKRDARSAKK